jgi:hypothetical protein
MMVRTTGVCKRMLGRQSGSPDPIPGPTLQVHHNENPKFLAVGRVEECVREPLAQAPADGAKNDRAGLRMFRDRIDTATNFGNEGGSESLFFVFVVLRGVVKFAFSQLVERDLHGSKPRACVPKHLVC